MSLFRPSPHTPSASAGAPAASDVLPAPRARRRSPLRAACALAAAAALFAVGAVPAPAARAAAPVGASGSPFQPQSDVVVIAFQQNWNSVGRMCTETLGPEGVGYVEISPPTEEIQGAEWWTSYQPVSYKLDSKEGTEAEFKDMIATCNAAGVGVVADAITNHMAAAPSDGSSQGVGVAGSTYTSDGSFPEVPWTASDFHTCTSGIDDYMDADQVRNCQLTGLQDLNTGDAHVQDVLADYLATLYNLGVSGFRMDAIKHIAPEEVLAIKQKVADKVGVGVDDIWYMQEVIGDSGNAAELMPSNYLASGDVSEFQFTYNVRSAFSMSLASLKNVGSSDAYVPSDKAAVFVSNWDTERNGNSLSYEDGKEYMLANAFMLAYGYGTPNIESGYVVGGHNDGAPGATDTSIPDTECGAGSPWLCVERWTVTRGMIAFHNATMGEEVTDWWDDGSQQIAFGRGSKGFIAMNNGDAAATNTYTTSVPAGTYCNLYGPGDCSDTVTVADDGTFTATVDAQGAVAFTVDRQACPDTASCTAVAWGADGAASDPSDPPLTDSGKFDTKAIDMSFGGVYPVEEEEEPQEQCFDADGFPTVCSDSSESASPAVTDSAAADTQTADESSSNSRANVVWGVIVLAILVAAAVAGVRRKRQLEAVAAKSTPVDDPAASALHDLANGKKD